VISELRLAADSFRPIVSSPSMSVSWLIATVTVFVVWPEVNVSLPGTG
jgi:hypothetical protein